MNKNWKLLLCVLAALLVLTACRSGGGETTVPTVTLPQGEGVEEWDDPIVTDPTGTEPIQTLPAGSDEPQVTDPTAETTEPVEDPTEPSGQTDPTEPAETTRPTEPPTPTDPPAPPATTEPQGSSYDPSKLTYEEYLKMSPAEQQAHYEAFPSLEAYIAWHNAALAEYEENQDSIEVTGGIDIGDFMNP